MNSIRRMSVFVSRQLSQDERTRLRNEFRKKLGRSWGAKRGSGVVMSSYGISKYCRGSYVSQVRYITHLFLR